MIMNLANKLTLADLNTLINKALSSAGTAHEIVPIAGTRQIKVAEIINASDQMQALAITTEESSGQHMLLQIIEQHADYLVLTNAYGQQFDIHFKPLAARLTLAEAQDRANSLSADAITEHQWCKTVIALLTEKGPGFGIHDHEADAILFLLPNSSPPVLCGIATTAIQKGDYDELIEVEAHNLDIPDEELSNPDSPFRQVVLNPTYVALKAADIEGFAKVNAGG